MKRFLNTLIIALTATSLPWCPRAEAQSESDSLINVEFPGGTIADYVNAIRDATGEANIVVMPDARDIEMPPIQLKSVALGAALELIQGDFQPDDRTLIKISTEEIGPWEEGEQPLYRVSAHVRHMGRRPSAESGVWALTDLLFAEMKPEDVLTAVETAVGLLAEAHESAQIRFHEATGLLIARGRPEQMEAIERVVDQLRESAAVRRDAAQRGGEESVAGLLEWIEAMKRLEIEQEGGREVLEQAQARIEELRTVMVRNAEEAEELRVQHRAAERMRDELMLETEHLRVQLREKDGLIRELETRLNEAQKQ